MSVARPRPRAGSARWWADPTQMPQSVPPAPDTTPRAAGVPGGPSIQISGAQPHRGGAEPMATRAAPRTPRRVPHPSVDDRRARGLEARERAPLSSHTPWAPASHRPDPVGLLEAQNRTREPDLVPVRHGRMLVSPFTFYRGTAKIMAADLTDTPAAGLDVQLCGDAHLSNFGVFASPERRLLFDLNDFDETLPGPFEYDVKRMAASFTIAARNNGFAKADARAATQASVAAYREAMAGFAQMGTLEVWYSHLNEDELLKGIRSAAAEASKTKKGAKVARQAEKSARRSAAKAHTRDSLQALSKLAELATLRDDQRQLLERFRLVDLARKVVGVGSVGTRAFIALLQGRDQQDPLFLQVKEATASVLEGHLPKSRYKQHGERVVYGQRMMQAASDIYLGWTKGPLDDTRHYYWRQLRDMKGSADVESMALVGLRIYAAMCGWTLARAHALSGDPVAIAEYLGKRDTFDQSIVDFSKGYADQNELDYQAFAEAIRSGRLQALEGV